MDRAEHYYRALYTVAKAVASSLDFKQVLDSITRAAAWAVGAKACIVRVLGHHGEELIATASYGLSDDYLRKGAVEVGKSPTDQEVLAGKVVQIHDMATDPRVQYPDEAKREGLASLLVLPLLIEGKGIGVMRFYSSHPREFSREEVEFLGAVADLSALAIENARIHQALRMDYEALTNWFTHHGP